MTTLRLYQQQMVDETLAHLRAGLRSVLLIGPTGSGKGELISHFLQLAVSNRRRALFAVHLSEIVLDVRARLVAAGVPEAAIRVLMGTRSEGPEDAPITVASWQTLAARQSELDVHLVLADEAHRSKTTTVIGVLDRHRAAVILGFTATGQRGDGSGLGPVGYQVIVAGPQIGALVRAGHLAPVRVLAPSQFVEALAEEPAAAYCRDARGRPAIFFCSSLSHSRQVAAALVDRGARAVHVDSDTPAEERAAAIEQLEGGQLDAITNFRLFVEGVNVRRISAVVLASAFSHDGPYLQAIGRGRRVLAGKSDCLILDLRGNFHRRGHPDEDRTYHLEGTAMRRLTSLPPVVQCRACLAWCTPARACRACGATLPPPRPPRISKQQLREQRLARVVKAGPDWERWCSIVREGRAKGWKPQAAAMRYRAVSGGRWPRWTAAMVPLQGTAQPAHHREGVQA